MIEAGAESLTEAPRPRPPAPETLRLYAGDWAVFCDWCRLVGRLPLPAGADTLEHYVRETAPTLGRGALDRRLAAIAYAHRSRGVALPSLGPEARNSLREAKRLASRGARRERPVSPETLVRLAAGCQGDTAGLRDRAFLLLAAATGLGRAALVGLDAEHVRFTPSGYSFTVPESAGGEVRVVDVPRAPSGRLCPARALEDWLRVSDTRFGPVFRKVDRWGNVEHARIGTGAIPGILRRHEPKRRRGASGSSTAADGL